MYVSPAGYCSYRREHAMANIYLQPYSHCFFSRNPVNQVIPGICADDAAHLPNGQGERRLLEGLLHLPPPEETQIALGPVAGAVAPLGGILGKGSADPLGLDLGFVLLQFGHCIFGSCVNLLAGPTGHRITRARVLDEEMSAAYLGHGLEITGTRSGTSIAAMHAEARICYVRPTDGRIDTPSVRPPPQMQRHRIRSFSSYFFLLPWYCELQQQQQHVTP